MCSRTRSQMIDIAPIIRIDASSHARRLRAETRNDEAIAEDGNTAPMFELFDASHKVTQVVDLVPVIPTGTAAPNFPFELFDELEFEINARGGDRFSWASMLVCTNDGMTGLDAVKLPKTGQSVFFTHSYDAGTEDNIEESEFLIDACSLLDVPPLGEPDVVGNDPDGNANDEVDTDPRLPIHAHPGLAGTGDLDSAIYGWADGPVAKVTIEKL